jgi:hypothetical protein
MRTNNRFTTGQWGGLALLAIPLVMGATACAGDREEVEQTTVEPEGPALIMFYTDG